MSLATMESEGEEKLEKKLKYQKEIDGLNLAINCPDKLSDVPDSLEAFRFCRNPIDVVWIFYLM